MILSYYIILNMCFGAPKNSLTTLQMVDPGHCPVVSKYGPSLSKVVGPVDTCFLVVKKSHFNKKYSSYSESTNSTKPKVHVGCQYSKTCLKRPLNKVKTKLLITNGSRMKVEWIAECSPWHTFDLH